MHWQSKASKGGEGVVFGRCLGFVLATLAGVLQEQGIGLGRAFSFVGEESQ